MKYLHQILIILNIISLLFLVQIVFNMIPSIDYNFPIEKIERINDLIVDLSIGVITSSFFYYLLVYIPEKRKQKIVRAMIDKHLIRISNDMINIVAYLADIYSIKSKSNLYDDISVKSFNCSIKGLDIIEPKEYVHELLDDIKSKYIEKISLESIYHGRFDPLTIDIKKILAIPSIIYEDTELVNILTSIKECGLFHMLANDFETEKDPKLRRRSRRLFESDKFYMHYLSLLKYIKPTPIILRKATLEDIEDSFEKNAY